MDADIASAARLFADTTRAGLLASLLDGRSLTAGDLARQAGVSAATASAHLRRLLDAGAVSLEASGRHRYYRLSDARIARAFEALAAVAPATDRAPGRSRIPAELRWARRCYDHLAGTVGVRMADSLTKRRFLVNERGTYRVTARGQELFGAFGIDMDQLTRARRSFAFACLDWSERTHHVAGALGAAILAELKERGWVQAKASSRALAVSPAGVSGLEDVFGVTLAEG